MCKTEESSMTPLLFSTVLHGAFTLATSGTKRSLYRTSSSRALSPQMRSCRGLAGGKTTPILQEVVQHVPSGSRAGPWSPQSLGDRPGPPPHPARCEREHHPRSVHGQEGTSGQPRAASSTPWEQGARRPARVEGSPGRRRAAPPQHTQRTWAAGPRRSPEDAAMPGSPGRGAVGPPGLPRPSSSIGASTPPGRPDSPYPPGLRTESARFQELASYGSGGGEGASTDRPQGRPVRKARAAAVKTAKALSLPPKRVRASEKKKQDGG